MHIIEDSRQQNNQHELKHLWFEHNDVVRLKSKLPFGDYALPPLVAVDTKASMEEIATNIGTSDHKRFRQELKLAQEFGCHLYILVENTEGIHALEQVAYWENPRIKYSPKAITGERLCKAMQTMQEYYGCTFLFCTPEESASLIIDILGKGI